MNPNLCKMYQLTFLLLLILSTTAQYLSKDRGLYPVDDSSAQYVARSGKTQFWVVDKQGWNVILSAYPVRPNAVTKVQFNLVVGTHFAIGICNSQNTRWVNYLPFNGQLGKPGSSSSYASPAYQGDNITLTIDLRPFENTVSFARNGLPMGIAASGFNRWNQDIYIDFGIYKIGHRIRIIDYYVQE